MSHIAKDKEPPRSFNELMNTPINFLAFVMNILQINSLTQEILVGPAYNLLKGTCKSFVKLEYHFEEVYKAVNDRLDWNNPEGNVYPFDLRKPLPLIQNDKGGSVSRKYTISTTKTKAALYDNIKGIEDMVLTLWSPTKMAYDKHALWGVSHWGPKRKRFYGYACHFESNHDVFSTKRIIGVTHIDVDKRYDYGYLNTFKEGDFPRLNLCDIEDVLLLLRVEDLQLGFESYQKKLNITRPQTFKSGITKLTPYTAYNDPQGIIYQDKQKRNRLMRLDELYKFCDRMLTDVRSVLDDITKNRRMEYLPKRDWTRLDRTRSRIIIKKIDELLFERRLMRNLERFVGGREYGNDFRLLERTI
ncbi:hypothetical protein Tco_1564026 [Tanacetum coccineum]